MMLKSKWGRIINISSASASIGNRSVKFAAAKAGVEAFTKSLAKEGKRDITINAVVRVYFNRYDENNDGVNEDYLLKKYL